MKNTMKYRLTFQLREPLSLPFQYNKILQAALLHWIGDEEFSTFLHDGGYDIQKRTYKLFSFSNIYGTYSRDTRTRKITFCDEIQIYLSFYSDESHAYVLKTIEQQTPIRFGRQFCPLINCEWIPEVYEDCLVKTMSPISIHSTLIHPEDHRQKTYYFSPYESDFSRLIRENLLKKYQAYHGTLPRQDDFKISPHASVPCRESVLTYNRFIIKGWNGIFSIKGSPELIRLALLGGIGARNSIGLGFVLQKKELV
ncbi:MAG: CRISPR-associated endoribonuclease Cas6 [Lachnospiraceae bacterium]